MLVIHFRNIFMGKEKRKKTVNVLIALSISYKSCLKTFLKWFINNCLASINITQNTKTKQITDYHYQFESWLSWRW